jgi:hypothetical protein
MSFRLKEARYATCCTSQGRRLLLIQLRTVSAPVCRFPPRIQIQDTQEGQTQAELFPRDHEASHTECALLKVCKVRDLDRTKMTP